MPILRLYVISQPSDAMGAGGEEAVTRILFGTFLLLTTNESSLIPMPLDVVGKLGQVAGMLLCLCCGMLLIWSGLRDHSTKELG